MAGVVAPAFLVVLGTLVRACLSTRALRSGTGDLNSDLFLGKESGYRYTSPALERVVGYAPTAYCLEGSCSTE